MSSPLYVGVLRGAAVLPPPPPVGLSGAQADESSASAATLPGTRSPALHMQFILSLPSQAFGNFFLKSVFYSIFLSVPVLFIGTTWNKLSLPENWFPYLQTGMIVPALLPFSKGCCRDSVEGSPDPPGPWLGFSVVGKRTRTIPYGNRDRVFRVDWLRISDQAVVSVRAQAIAGVKVHSGRGQGLSLESRLGLKLGQVRVHSGVRIRVA